MLKILTVKENDLIPIYQELVQKILFVLPEIAITKHNLHGTFLNTFNVRTGIVESRFLVGIIAHAL